jgi:uncharacterized membrane protein
MTDETPLKPADSAPAQTISDLHARHYRAATPIQRLLDGAVGKLGHPLFLALLTLVVSSWLLFNLAMAWRGVAPFDPPPFQGLQATMAVLAVYFAALILTTQHREDRLARHRDQLTLELAILGEYKMAKIIALLEELRRDNPMMKDRVDDAAEAMARPTDVNAVLSVLEDVQRAIADERE